MYKRQSWNYIFRSSINLSRTFFAYERKADVQQYSGSTGQEALDSQARTKGREQGENPQTPFTLEDFLQGAKQLCKALWGKYKDLDGRIKAVRGDMTKLRWVVGLSRAARKLLDNIEHTSRRLPGTQEVRRLMRFDTNAMRVRYGVPIFVTFSPDEAHNLLMIRLSRTRRNDPVFAEGSDPVGRRYCGRHAPHLGDFSGASDQYSMDAGGSRRRDITNRPSCADTSKTTSVDDQDADVIMDVPIEDIIDSLPSYDERRRLLARDALASVDGFKMLLVVTYLSLIHI